MVEGNDKQPEREQLTLLLDSGELRTVDLGLPARCIFPTRNCRSSSRITWRRWRRAHQGQAQRVPRFHGTAARDIVASYTVPAPVWKSSYRLIFGASGQPTLEGWAIVDNTTNEDWTNIRLSLVSGGRFRRQPALRAALPGAAHGGTSGRPGGAAGGA